MIIIDQQTDNKLIEALEALREEANMNPASIQTTRCVHFKFSRHPNLTTSTIDIRKYIIAMVGQYIPSPDVQIYICEDGDIFILAPNMASKAAKEMIFATAAQLHAPVSDEFVSFYELSLSLNKMLVMLEEKLQKKRDAIALLEKQKEEVIRQRKREMILNSGAKSSAADIAAKRSHRHSPELMIIEDDAFSRRLVENVLQKQYALTGLADADLALATYAHKAPDILFLDINLPDVTGHELLEKIIALDPEAYIIMLSGNADKDNITQAMGKGAKGFIAKPFSKEKLFQYIERCPTIHATGA